MSKTTHTPGPWLVGGEDGAIWIEGPDPQEPVLCDIVRRLDIAATIEDEANALLIAAAPDLLKSVEELMAAFGGVATHPQQAAWDWAKAALLLARGEGGEQP